MTDQERFEYQRKAFRQFLANLNQEQLLQIADDLEKRLDYVSDLMDSWIDRDKFSNFMKDKW